MNQDQVWSAVRSVLKVLAGYAIARGWGDNTLWEGVAGAVVGVAAMVWSHWEHATPPAGGAS